MEKLDKAAFMARVRADGLIKAEPAGRNDINKTCQGLEWQRAGYVRESKTRNIRKKFQTKRR